MLICQGSSKGIPRSYEIQCKRASARNIPTTNVSFTDGHGISLLGYHKRYRLWEGHVPPPCFALSAKRTVQISRKHPLCECALLMSSTIEKCGIGNALREAVRKPRRDIRRPLPFAETAFWTPVHFENGLRV